MGSRRRGKWQRLKSGIAAFLALSVSIGACIAAIALGLNLTVVIIISITNRSKYGVSPAWEPQSVKQSKTNSMSTHPAGEL